MKKILLTILTLCLAGVSAFAGSDLSVVNGDKKFFKNASGKVNLVIDWSQATFDDRMTLEEKFGDMTDRKAASRSGFIQDFSKIFKNLPIVDGDADYKIEIMVSKIDQYIKVMGFIPGPATKTWGTLTVTDLRTGEALLTIAINECDGGASPSPDESFSDSFESIACQLAKLK